MRLCLMVEGQEDVSWDEWLALADACERAGLEGLFRSDHYLSVIGRRERASHDAIATLAALAARTERIRLGTLVSPVTFRHPSVLAKSVATIDHVSGGRVELGLGAGWNEGEHAAYGFDFPRLGTRMELLEEQLEIVHRLWTEGSVTFAGRHYRLEDCPALPKPLQQPRPPLILGGSAKARAVALAVRLADEYNTLLASIDDCRERKSVLVEACESAGRDPATLPLTLMATCVVGEDGGQVLERGSGSCPRRAARAVGGGYARRGRRAARGLGGGRRGACLSPASRARGHGDGRAHRRSRTACIGGLAGAAVSRSRRGGP
jgi:F420-dependent oxidoreductase-like protein